MNNPSSAQLMYLRQCRRHQLKIKIFRVLILVVFLLQWELCARYGKIDPFIFSSPTRLIICFYQMITSQKLLYHIGITLFETLSSFFLCYYFNITDCCNPLVFQNLIRNLRALSCGFKFPAKICAGSAADCMAGRQLQDHYHHRYVRSYLWLYSESLHCFL